MISILVFRVVGRNACAGAQRCDNVVLVVAMILVVIVIVAIAADRHFKHIKHLLNAAQREARDQRGRADRCSAAYTRKCDEVIVLRCALERERATVAEYRATSRSKDPSP